MKSRAGRRGTAWSRRSRFACAGPSRQRGAVSGGPTLPASVVGLPLAAAWSADGGEAAGEPVGVRCVMQGWSGQIRVCSEDGAGGVSRKRGELGLGLRHVRGGCCGAGRRGRRGSAYRILTKQVQRVPVEEAGLPAWRGAGRHRESRGRFALVKNIFSSETCATMTQRSPSSPTVPPREPAPSCRGVCGPRHLLEAGPGPSEPLPEP